MPFSFGTTNKNTSGSSTATDNTTQNSNFNQTTAPVVPDWITNMAQGLNDNASTLAGANPASYVAGPNALLTTAANSAGDLNGTPWDYNAANDVAAGVANAKTPSIAGNIPGFMSPYLSGAVRATSAALDHSDALARSQDTLTKAGSGAFGGSGAALGTAALDQGLSLARGQTIGGMENEGYGQALSGATAQAQLQQQQQAQRLAAANTITNNANDYGANVRANIATQDSAAGPLQAIAQSTATAPLDLQAWLASIFGQSNPGLFVGQNQSGTEDQTGVENQQGSSTGNTSGFSFGFN